MNVPFNADFMFSTVMWKTQTNVFNLSAAFVDNYYIAQIY